MVILTKDQILKAQDLQREEVDVSQWWGGGVICRELTAGEAQEIATIWDDWKKTRADDKDKTPPPNIREKICVRGIINEDGTRMFTDGEFIALAGKNVDAINKVFPVIQRLSGLIKSDGEDVSPEKQDGKPGNS